MRSMYAYMNQGTSAPAHATKVPSLYDPICIDMLLRVLADTPHRSSSWNCTEQTTSPLPSCTTTPPHRPTTDHHTSTRSDNKINSHAGRCEMQLHRLLTCSTVSTSSSSKETPSSDTSSTRMLRHRRHLIAKVYINMVSINKTTSSTHRRRHTTSSTRMNPRPLTVLLQGDMTPTTVLTASDE
jgi:hypothetical protein